MKTNESAVTITVHCRCVYDCDNDVCDSQMVNIQFQNGAVANLTMTAFTEAICARHTRITGSKVIFDLYKRLSYGAGLISGRDRVAGRS